MKYIGKTSSFDILPVRKDLLEMEKFRLVPSMVEKVVRVTAIAAVIMK